MGMLGVLMPKGRLISWRTRKRDYMVEEGEHLTKLRLNQGLDPTTQVCKAALGPMLSMER